MLYFAYGSNLYHKQMKKRCKQSKYIKCYILKNYKLSFRNNFLGGGVGDTFAFALRKSTDSGSSFGVIGMTGGRVDGTTQPNNKLCWTVSAVTKITNASTHRIDIMGLAMAMTGDARIMGGSQADITQVGGSALLIEKVANL